MPNDRRPIPAPIPMPMSLVNSTTRAQAALRMQAAEASNVLGRALRSSELESLRMTIQLENERAALINTRQDINMQSPPRVLESERAHLESMTEYAQTYTSGSGQVAQEQPSLSAWRPPPSQPIRRSPVIPRRGNASLHTVFNGQKVVMYVHHNSYDSGEGVSIMISTERGSFRRRICEVFPHNIRHGGLRFMRRIQSFLDCPFGLKVAVPFGRSNGSEGVIYERKEG